MDSYRAAVQLNPADELSHYKLGLELAVANEPDAARKELGEAARLNPDSVRAHFNYGALLIEQNHWDEAQREFETVLRLEPGNVRAQECLSRVRAKKERAP